MLWYSWKVHLMNATVCSCSKFCTVTMQTLFWRNCRSPEESGFMQKWNEYFDSALLLTGTKYTDNCTGSDQNIDVVSVRSATHWLLMCAHVLHRWGPRENRPLLYRDCPVSVIQTKHRLRLVYEQDWLLKRANVISYIRYKTNGMSVLPVP